MAKPLFIIITRMHAPKNSREDEFTSLWLREAEREDAYYVLKTCDVLLVHGYMEKYLPKRNSKRNSKEIAINQIQMAIKNNNVTFDQYDSVYVLFHGSDTFMLTPDELARISVPASAKIVKYSSLPTSREKLGPGIDGALEQLPISNDIRDEVKRARSLEPGTHDEPTPASTASARQVEFSHLKHQIAHLFLPLSIDLQGMALAEGEERLAYAIDMLRERSEQKNFLRQKFSDLRFLVAKVDDNGGKTLSEDSVLFSVWAWLRSARLESSDASKNLLALAGMVLLKNDKPVLDDRSHVPTYFEDLDQETNPAKLLAAMTKPFKINLWNNGQSEVADLKFEAWLNKLDSVLDELRTMLIERADDRQQAIQNTAN